MAEEDSPYSPFAPPIDYDTSKLFVVNPICADFKIERTSRPAQLPQHIQLIQPQQQCTRRGIRSFKDILYCNLLHNYNIFNFIIILIFF